jgi:hypothetical protein
MQKINQNKQAKSSRLYRLGLLAWLLVIFLGVHHSAMAASSKSSSSPSSPTSSTSNSGSSAFIQSYNATTDLQQGMIVQLKKSSGNGIEPASQTSIYQTFGVVVNINSAAIAVQNEDKSGTQVFVATSGHYDILVSDQNGAIEAGDYITLSPIDGIGMKDNSSQPIVVAQALSSFNGTGPLIGSDKLKTSTGTETVHLGLVNAIISIGHNPLLVASNSDVPRVLAQFSQSIAGKPVSSWRIWIGVAILGVIAFIVGSMLYGAVRSSLISIGRNPLSRKAITKGFVQVVLSALIIFTSAVFGVYLLLKA